MTETQKNCATCGQAVIDVNGILAHAGGGATTQVCRSQSCGWKGGSVEKFSVCPSCGDATSLATDHVAS